MYSNYVKCHVVMTNLMKYTLIFFCKTYLSYYAIYFPKWSIPLSAMLCSSSLMWLLQWSMYMGKNASPCLFHVFPCESLRKLAHICMCTHIGQCVSCVFFYEFICTNLRIHICVVLLCVNWCVCTCIEVAHKLSHGIGQADASISNLQHTSWCWACWLNLYL